jgi:hypothetical protein
LNKRSGTDGRLVKAEGQRVVAGQRMMQAASDIFFGWHQAETGL